MPKLTQNQNPETIAEYSDALRKRLAGTLPPEKMEEVVAETQAHLEDSAAELRYQADVYERQAIAHFVPVSKLSRGISRAWAPVFLRHSGTKPLQNISALVSVLSILWALTAMIARYKFPTWFFLGPLGGILLWAIPLTVFLLALLACRPQLKRFAYGGLVSLLACAFLGGWLCLSTQSSHLLSRFDAPAAYKEIRKNYDAHNAEIRLLRTGLASLDLNYRLGYSQASQESRLSWFIAFNQLSTKDQIAVLNQRLQVSDDLYGRVKRYIRKQDSDFNWHENEQSKLKKQIENLKKQPEITRQERYKQQLAMLPAELRQGDQIRIPSKYNHGTNEGWAFEVKETTMNPQEALTRWGSEGQNWLAMHEQTQVWNKRQLNECVALMGDSKWRFDVASAQEIGRMAAVGIGGLITADLLGGYLGMFLLKLRRRRQTKPFGLGA
jgi:hypothetical protein